LQLVVGAAGINLHSANGVTNNASVPLIGIVQGACTAAGASGLVVIVAHLTRHACLANLDMVSGSKRRRIDESPSDCALHPCRTAPFYSYVTGFKNKMVGVAKIELADPGVGGMEILVRLATQKCSCVASSH
jgi:hypothetical protein